MRQRYTELGSFFLRALLIALTTNLGGLAVNVVSSQEGRWWGSLELIHRHPFRAAILLTIMAMVLLLVDFLRARRADVDPVGALPVPASLPDWVVRRGLLVDRAVHALAASRRARRHGRPTRPGGRRPARGPVVVRHGTGGCGKTTLAAMVCADRRVRRHFRGGVYTIVMGPDLRGRAAIAARVNELAMLTTGARPGFEQAPHVIPHPAPHLHPAEPSPHPREQILEWHSSVPRRSRPPSPEPAWTLLLFTPACPFPPLRRHHLAQLEMMPLTSRNGEVPLEC
ncbi:hypothetical protein [Streptomyces sp. NPDC050504]|uniref:hypothetical protein n=1 Tax=Streptomyces sp. NPDC050504 TaxID=3365618 RepID=UPI00379F54A6